LKIVNHARYPLKDVVAVFSPQTQFPVRVPLGDLSVEGQFDRDVDGAEGDLVFEYTYDGRRRRELVGYSTPGDLLEFEVNRAGGVREINAED